MHTQTNRRLTLSTGIRKGYYEQYSERDQEQFKQSAWTGQAGIVYEINDKWAPYLHWNNSFSPSMALDKDNRLLSPTTGQEWEAGIRYNPKSSIQITASVFDLRRQNIHVPVWGESYYTSIGEITSQGFELEGRAVINDYLRILGSYTYMDPRVTQHTNPARIGKRPAGVANHSFNIRADAVLSRFDNGELTWGIGLRHIGKRMDEDNEITLGGVTLYDTSYHSHGGITPGRFISATSSIRNTYPALNLFGVFPPDSPDRNAHGSFPISISGDHEKYKTVKSFLRPWWHLASPFWKSENACRQARFWYLP